MFSGQLKQMTQVLLKEGEKSSVLPVRAPSKVKLKRLLCLAVSCPTVKLSSLDFETPQQVVVGHFCFVLA